MLSVWYSPEWKRANDDPRTQQEWNFTWWQLHNDEHKAYQNLRPAHRLAEKWCQWRHTIVTERRMWRSQTEWKSGMMSWVERDWNAKYMMSWVEGVAIIVIEGDWYKCALRFKFPGDWICYRCDTALNEKEQMMILGHNRNGISLNDSFIMASTRPIKI